MINGEKTGEKTSSSNSAIAGVDPLDELSSSWLDRRSDADDSPSRSSYSSCGESEFERYCSANSVLGTASLCSSVGTCNEFLGSDFGSVRNLGFGRSSGSRSVVAVSESLDCLSDGGNEFHEENGEFGGSLFLDCRSGSESLLGSGVNSPSFRVNHEENSDEILKKLGVGGGSKSLWSPYRNSQSGRGVCEENNDRNEMSSGLERDSGLLLASAKNRNEFLMLHSGRNGCPSLPSTSENYPSYDAFGEEKNTENILDEEAPRCEHSDAEDSSLDYGTDDEDRSCAERRNLQYLKETRPENENVLLMNSVAAFGCDDWDEYMQDIEGNNMAPVLLEKPLEQQQELLENEKTHLAIMDSSITTHVDALSLEEMEQDEHVRDIPIASYQVQDINESAENIKGCLVANFLVKKELPAQNTRAETQYMVKDSDAAKSHLTIKDDAHESKLQYICSEEPVGLNEDGILDTKLLGLSDPLFDVKGDQLQSLQFSATEAFQDKESGLYVAQKLNAPLPLAGNSHINVMQTAKDSAASIHLDKECPAPSEVEKLETDEFYDEMFHEMEEILLDSGRPYGARISFSQRSSSQLSQSLRDGGSTASTSGTDDAYPSVPYPLKIDWVEVVGAKQKRGDVSFGERLVGVKEYTVYVIRVWSGKDQWDVERRYRDFFTLYRQLKTLFTDRGYSLPPPWSSIDRESRKIFGNASPNVISDRSILIQDCIRSILNGSPFGTPNSLVWFLSPCKPLSSSSAGLVPNSMQKLAHDDQLTSSFSGESLSEGTSALGKTISLLVEIKPHKSMEQLLEEQFYTCAGCHKRLDTGKSLMQELVHTLGWGKPRLCEYTGQLFCASCHTNDTAVLPARVLHFWDFSLYPVSQLAKAYLESIYDQPMLCVSAVNPFLFSKVPTLLHVMGIRKKIGAMFPHLQCPFRRSIQRGLGSRRYLLENNEFFALRDLVDLSKGAFAALPAMIETVSAKILEHITQQCLVCCDVGIPCGARQACEDPASLIFPFQEDEITRCSSCDSVFHKSCFGKLLNCPCGTPAEAGERLGPMEQGKHMDRDEKGEVLDILTRKPDTKLSVGFFSDLWGPRKNNPVILMGSLPSTAL